MVVDDPYSFNIKTLDFLKTFNFRIRCLEEFIHESKADGGKSSILEFFKEVDCTGLTEQVSERHEIGQLFAAFFDYHYSPKRGYGGLGLWERFLKGRLKSDLDDRSSWLPVEDYEGWEREVYDAEQELEPARQDEFGEFSRRALILIEDGKLSLENLSQVGGLDDYFVEGMQYAVANFKFIMHDSLPQLGSKESDKIRERFLGGLDPEWLEEISSDKLRVSEHVWGGIRECAENDFKTQTIIRQYLQSNHSPAEILQILVGDHFCDSEMSDYYPDLAKIERAVTVTPAPTSLTKIEHVAYEGHVVEAVKRSSVNFAEYRETEDTPTPDRGGDYDTSPSDVFTTGEDGILEKICQTYQISTFEADEILAAHRAFDGATINLKSTYGIRFIEQTEEFLAALDRNKAKTGFFGKVSKLTTTLSRDPRNMWRKYQETRILHRSLVKTVDTYELPKATGERPESIITAIYNFRNEAGDISDAQASMEGRRIFDTLRRKEHMLERLDV